MTNRLRSDVPLASLPVLAGMILAVSRPAVASPGPRDLLILFDNRPGNAMPLPDGGGDCRWKQSPFCELDRTVADGLEPRGNRTGEGWPFRDFENALVRLLWLEEDGTIEPFRWNRPAAARPDCDRKSGDRACTDGRRAGRNGPETWHGSLDDYRRSLRRCARPGWVRTKGETRNPEVLQGALATLAEWQLRQPNPPGTTEAPRGCEQALVLALTGPWTTEVLAREDVETFLDRLKELPPGRLCTAFVVEDRTQVPEEVRAASDAGLLTLVETTELSQWPAGAWTALLGFGSGEWPSSPGVVSPREGAGNGGSLPLGETWSCCPGDSASGGAWIRSSCCPVQESPFVFDGRTGSRDGEALRFGFACGEALDAEQCRTRLCESFWDRAGAHSTLRFRRITLVGGPSVDESEGRLLCGRRNQLVSVAFAQPEHPVQHLVLVDRSESMGAGDKDSDRRKLYERLLHTLQPYTRPQDDVSLCALGRYVECYRNHRAGVDAGAWSPLPTFPLSQVVDAASSILRAILVVAGDAAQDFSEPVLLPDPPGPGPGVVDPAQDSPPEFFRSQVGRTLVWLFSDCLEATQACNMEKRLERVPPLTDARSQGIRPFLANPGCIQPIERLKKLLPGWAPRHGWKGGTPPTIVVVVLPPPGVTSWTPGLSPVTSAAQRQELARLCPSAAFLLDLVDTDLDSTDASAPGKVRDFPLFRFWRLNVQAATPAR